MAKDYLKSAKLLKRQILSMIHDREKELRGLQKQYNMLENFIDNYPHMNVDSGANNERNKNKNRPTVNSNKVDVAEAAYKLIKMRDKPIKRDELYDLLIQQGVIINGKNPKMILSTMLWRVKNSGVVRLKSGGYWLKDRRYPPADYIPEEKKSKNKNSKQMDLINHFLS